MVLVSNNLGASLTGCLLYAATGLNMYGLYRYNTEDVGITEGVKKLWHAQRKSKKNDIRHHLKMLTEIFNQKK